MKSKTIVVSLFAAAALSSGCAIHEAGYGSNRDGFSPVRSNDGYYAVIESIESARPTDDPAKGSTGAYSIRVRFDDRTYRTVTQSELDGLRVGDSVRIESDRARRYH